MIFLTQSCTEKKRESFTEQSRQLIDNRVQIITKKEFNFSLFTANFKMN